MSPVEDALELAEWARGSDDRTAAALVVLADAYRKLTEPVGGMDLWVVTRDGDTPRWTNVTVTYDTTILQVVTGAETVTFPLVNVTSFGTSQVATSSDQVGNMP